ncbi:hypothetical protein [Aureimonas leprariae]|uniref:Hydrophobic W protein n=1 Tax=Plantimonas leprariae TaxID=2615207 RepID=A0A7V7PN45_9HYPH|nr:hypothetical protein [Aureimonas leprariae]KAB0679029.1 hypothetical protein F6X38_14115 [Aureimonas leprariae]
MSDGQRTATLSVERGLHTLTYRFDPSFALALAAAPVVDVVHASAGISILSAPGTEFGVLAEPGQGLVVLAEQPGTLHLVVRPSVPGGSLDAELALTRVEAPRPAMAKGGPERSPLPDGAGEFLVRAHLSLRGDVSGGRGSWIGGPQAPGRIEGLEIRPIGGALALEYQVATAGRTGGWSAWVPAGAYAGSRGKGMPLIGLRIRLRGDAPDHLELRGEALFLGASPIARNGREIELVGASPLDPLVGLRLDIAAAAEAGEAGAPQGQNDAAPALNRLRVFRRTQPDARAA